MSMFNTYDHTKVNISLNGISLTDFNGDPTITKEGPEFEVVEGSNGAIERSRMVRNLYTVNLPMMQTSPQLNAIETLRISDEKAGAGPFPFAITDLNGAYVLMGQAWIESMGDATKGRQAQPRTVVLRVKAEAAFEGA
ncbi:hypothetical protein [Fibrobacter sp. UWH4]|uniref:hypothetical protein n=1 Tax=Fibrobacter sp. UWH4 TaxID=1896210 RepID=UPI00092262AF|nr:hypothetical protein [Fibrobacter sp. UWH4]SHL04836.1 hypothetical protein SAMN05720762_10457 [Fibrobacter sp. UWH4]